MTIRFLGTGTSTGNPEIGCSCRVCKSKDPKDYRLRASALIEVDGNYILIDCGPDFRIQMLDALKYHSFDKLDGVLLTHEHYDHVGGLDDLRSFSRHGAVEIYAEEYVAEAIKSRIPYVFQKHKYPGVPNLEMNEIDLNPFRISGIEIIPIRLMHGQLPILGYRIGKMAYLTDLKTIPESEYDKLKDLDVLIINALRSEPHIAHQTLEDAIRNVERIQPKAAYFIHMSHAFGLHEEMQETLPPKIFIAYDGLEVSI